MIQIRHEDSTTLVAVVVVVAVFEPKAKGVDVVAVVEPNANGADVVGAVVVAAVPPKENG